MSHRTFSCRIDRPWFVLACAGSLALVLATFARTLLEATGSPWAHPLRVLDLRAENNLAAWWSAMLLLMVAVHALDNFTSAREDAPRRARGWLLLALIGGVLTADELASLHERVSLFGKAAGIGGWTALAPFGLVLLGMLAAMLAAFRAGGLEKRRFTLIGAGLLLILSVPVQEFVEHRWTWSGPLTLALRNSIEEGTELLGILVLLRAAFVDGALRAGPAFEAVWRLRVPVALGGLLLTPVLAAYTMVLTDTAIRGVPANWPSAALLLAAALALLPRDRQDDGRRLLGYAASALAVIASAAAVQINIDSAGEIGGFVFSRRFLVLLVVALLVAALGWRRFEPTEAALASLTVAVAGMGSLLKGDGLASYLAFGVAATALYWASSRLAMPDSVRAEPAATRQHLGGPA